MTRLLTFLCTVMIICGAPLFATANPLSLRVADNEPCCCSTGVCDMDETAPCGCEVGERVPLGTQDLVLQVGFIQPALAHVVHGEPYVYPTEPLAPQGVLHSTGPPRLHGLALLQSLQRFLI